MQAIAGRHRNQCILGPKGSHRRSCTSVMRCSASTHARELRPQERHPTISCTGGAILRPVHQAVGTAGVASRAVAVRALPAGDKCYTNGDSSPSNHQASSNHALLGLPLLPWRPHGSSSRTPLQSAVQPLLAAVVTVSSGQLPSLPPGLLTWLLRTQAAMGSRPPAAWLMEACGSLAARLDELSPGQAAEAFLAIAHLGAADGSASLPPPPVELLTGLYDSMAGLRPAVGPSSARSSSLGPQLSLDCLEAAAAAAAFNAASQFGDNRRRGAAPDSAASEAATGPSVPSAPMARTRTAVDTPSTGPIAGGLGASNVGPPEPMQRGCSPGQGRWRDISILPAMPQSTVEPLALTAAGLPLPPQPSSLASSSASAAASSAGTGADTAAEAAEGAAGLGLEAPGLDEAAERASAGGSGGNNVSSAARALVASAHLVHPPGPRVVSLLAQVVAFGCGAVGGGGTSSGGGRGQGSGKGVRLHLPHIRASVAEESQQASLLVDALSAACALRCPPLPANAATALLSGLRTLLPALDAVQVCRAVTIAEHLTAAAAPDNVSDFVHGAAVKALTGLLPGLTAPQLAAALTALPSSLRPPPAELAAAAHEALRGCLAAADSDNVTEILRRLGDAGALPSYGWQGALAAATGRRLQDAAAVGLLSSQELCNTLYLLAALNYRPGFSWTDVAAAALQPRLLTLTAPQLTNALWALAKFGYRAEVGAPWSTYAVQALQLQLPSLRPHQVAYGLGSLQRLGCPVNAVVLDEMLTAAAEQVRHYPPADLVLLLMTVARLRHVPSYSFTEAVTERLRPHLVAATSADTATAKAVAVTEVQKPSLDSYSSPSAAAGASSGAGSTVGAASRVPVGIGFGAAAAAGGANVVFAAADGGTTAAAAAEAAPLTCQELASVGYALAKLHSRPEADWMALYMDACQARMAGFSADLLASLLWAVGELGQVPRPDWMSSYLAASHPQLGDFAPQDLVSVLSSLAALRSPPPAAWLGEALTVLGARVGGLDGAGVAALLKALVDLDARVSNPDWYEALCDQVSGFLPLLSAQALVDLVASLGALGHRPGQEWLTRCCAAATRVHASSSSSLPAASQAQASQQQQASQAQATQSGGAAAAAAAAAAASLEPAVQSAPGWSSGALGSGGAGREGSGGGGSGSHGGGGSGGSGLSARQLEALVCGLARLGAKPPPALGQAFFATTSPALPYMSPERVTALVSALAGAQVAPVPEWLDALAGAVRSNVMSYTLPQLDALTRALAVFQGLVPGHGGTRDLLAFLREFCLYG